MLHAKQEQRAGGKETKIPPGKMTRKGFLLHVMIKSMLCCWINLPRVRLFTPVVASTRSLAASRLTVNDKSNNNVDCTKTLAPGSFSAELEVKKSRFIGYAKHVTTWNDAVTYLDEIKAEHPKARHWTFGFRAGTNPVNERCSDDGEPTGTAGVPVLGAIRGQEFSNVVVCVVRYFGGIKLGAGGLIRSYGAAARLVLREAPVEVLIPMGAVRVKVDPSHVGSLYELVGKYSASTSKEDYLIDGSVEVTITCEAQHLDDFCTNIKDATRGQAIFDRDEAKTSSDA